MRVAESNAVLKLKFQRLHSTVVDSVTTAIASIIDFLFQEAVIGIEDECALNSPTLQGNWRERCRSLLSRLHSSENPEAFVKLYLAFKKERQLEWLVDRIDKFTDPSVISLVQEIYANEPTGFGMF